MLDESKIKIIHRDTQNTITVPTDGQFGSLRFQFEENGIVREFPIFPKLLHDLFMKDLYCHKESIKS